MSFHDEESEASNETESQAAAAQVSAQANDPTTSSFSRHDRARNGQGPEHIDHDPGAPTTHDSQASASFSRPRPRWLVRGKAHLITDARRSPLQNLHRRETAYKWLQGSRIPFLLASGVTYMWMHNIFLSVILFCISIPLPWIAVVIANGAGEPKDPRMPAVYKPALARMQAESNPQLAGGSAPALTAGAQEASARIFDPGEDGPEAAPGDTPEHDFVADRRDHRGTDSLSASMLADDHPHADSSPASPRSTDASMIIDHDNASGTGGNDPA